MDIFRMVCFVKPICTDGINNSLPERITGNIQGVDLYMQKEDEWVQFHLPTNSWHDPETGKKISSDEMIIRRGRAQRQR